MFLSAVCPCVATFMSLFLYFLPMNSQVGTAQLQESKACGKSNERLTWTRGDIKKNSLKHVNIPLRGDLQTSEK